MNREGKGIYTFVEASLRLTMVGNETRLAAEMEGRDALQHREKKR